MEWLGLNGTPKPILWPWAGLPHNRSGCPGLPACCGLKDEPSTEIPVLKQLLLRVTVLSGHLLWLYASEDALPGCKAMIIVTSNSCFFSNFTKFYNSFFSPFSIPLYLAIFVSSEENWTSSRGIKMDECINYFHVHVSH